MGAGDSGVPEGCQSPRFAWGAGGPHTAASPGPRALSAGGTPGPRAELNGEGRLGVQAPAGGQKEAVPG